jgi:hypothetical protein
VEDPKEENPKDILTECVKKLDFVFVEFFVKRIHLLNFRFKFYSQIFLVWNITQRITEKKFKQTFVWVHRSIQRVKKIHCDAVVHFGMH